MFPTWKRALLAASVAVLLAAPALANGHHGRETVYVAPAETVYVAPTATTYVASSYVVPTSYVESSYVVPTTFVESSYVVPTTFVESSYVVPATYSYVDVVPTSYVVPYRPRRLARTRYVESSAIYPTYYLATPTSYVPTSYVTAAATYFPTVFTGAVETVYTPCAEPVRVRTGTPQAGPGVSSKVQPNPDQGGATSGTSKPQGGAGANEAGGAGAGAATGDMPAEPKPGDNPGGLGMNDRARVRVAAKPPAPSMPILDVRVVDATTREPLEKFRVVASHATKQFEDREGTTDAYGRFALRLPPGDWVVKVARAKGGELAEAVRVVAAAGQVLDDNGRDLTASGFVVSR